MKYRERKTTYNITAMKNQTTVAVLLLAGLLVLATITVPIAYAKKHKADRTESAFGGSPMSEQHPDPKRLINDDPAGSPGDVGSIKGYTEGQKDYAKGIDKGFDAEPEGGHTTGYKKGFSEGYNLGHEDAQLKKNGQLSPDYLDKIK